MEVAPHPAFSKNGNPVSLAGLGKNAGEHTPIAVVVENDCLAITT